jgi:hypothetical protein
LEVGVLFGFGGASKTRGQLAKDELGIGFDHLMQAAQHAAGGAGAAIGPRTHIVRSVITPAAGRVRNAASSGWDSTVGAFSPLMTAAKEGAREATDAALKVEAKKAKRRQKEEQVKQRRIGLAVGLLTVGVAVGAAAALMMRRRRRMAWDEYNPSEAMESMMDSASERVSGSMMSAGDMAGEMGQKTGDAMKSTGERAGAAAKKAGDKAEQMSQKAGEAAKKSGDKVTGSGQDTRDEAGAYAADSFDSRMRRS